MSQIVGLLRVTITESRSAKIARRVGKPTAALSAA
jgi:hypothetical protein